MATAWTSQTGADNLNTIDGGAFFATRSGAVITIVSVLGDAFTVTYDDDAHGHGATAAGTGLAKTLVIPSSGGPYRVGLYDASDPGTGLGTGHGSNAAAIAGELTAAGFTDTGRTVSGTDYLVVLSSPPAWASRKAGFSYVPLVKSRRGSVRFKLDAFPEGMEMSEDGKLSWKIPRECFWRFKKCNYRPLL